jgi:hypothetical protein
MEMKLMAALAAFVFSTGLAWSAEEPVKNESSPVQEAQQEKQKPSSTRKAQREKKEPSPAQKAQREKMKTCSAEVREKGLKDDERKKFMSECLKKKDTTKK